MRLDKDMVELPETITCRPQADNRAYREVLRTACLLLFFVKGFGRRAFLSGCGFAKKQARLLYGCYKAARERFQRA
ncbi:hypothetical protein [Nitratireductor aquibiodomus]|nr:hypothetical protein [Nitratireductor aquibiodomus]